MKTIRKCTWIELVRNEHVREKFSLPGSDDLDFRGEMEGREKGGRKGKKDEEERNSPHPDKLIEEPIISIFKPQTKVFLLKL